MTPRSDPSDPFGLGRRGVFPAGAPFSPFFDLNPEPDVSDDDDDLESGPGEATTGPRTAEQLIPVLGATVALAAVTAAVVALAVGGLGFAVRFARWAWTR